MDRFGIERGDEAEILDLGLALVEAGARIGPGGDVGLREAGFGCARLNGTDIGDRAVRGDRGGDKTLDAGRSQRTARGLAARGKRFAAHLVFAGPLPGIRADECLDARYLGGGNRTGAILINPDQPIPIGIFFRSGLHQAGCSAGPLRIEWPERLRLGRTRNRYYPI